MIFRELFAEMPYAASLNTTNLGTRCSTCFSQPNPESKSPCERGCSVVYCNEVCRNSDGPFHKFECEFFLRSKSTKLDNFARLLARILARKDFDGGKAHLCTNFPTSVQDRQLSDLLSHQSEIEECEYRSKEMRSTLKQYRRAFEGTLLMDDWKAVRRMYCTMWINCFSVSGPLSMTKGHESSIGLGFYLNTSRFNHSCRPDLFVDFDGARIIIQYLSRVVNQQLIEKERSSLTKSSSKFNSLTISYGFSTSFTNDCVFPLRRQRQASLEFAYYFKCQCVLCSNDREAALEEHSAKIECRRCNEPYVWEVRPDKRSIWCWSASAKRAVTCRKSCRCRFKGNEKEDVEAFVQSSRNQLTYVALDGEWDKIMADSIQCKYANEIISECEPFLMKVRDCWHPAANLRLAQLHERLFVSYNVCAMASWKEQAPVDAHMVEMGLETGEALFSWFAKRPMNTYETAVAAYAYELAQLYELSGLMSEAVEAKKQFQRAAHWYTYAASMWKAHGDGMVGFASELTKCAEQVKCLSAENESST